jgi:hypothetical protein
MQVLVGCLASNKGYRDPDARYLRSAGSDMLCNNMAPADNVQVAKDKKTK